MRIFPKSRKKVIILLETAMESKKYTRVSVIDHPGNYVFSSNPNQSGDEKYYDGSLPDENVLGVRPYFEKTIDDFFKDKYPDLRVSNLPKRANLNQIEYWAQRRSWYPYHLLKNYPYGADFNSLVYKSTQPSIVTVNQEYYRFACQVQRFGIHIKEVKFSLKDNARHITNSQDRDGQLKFKAWECEYAKVCSDEMFWRGSLKFRGKNLGSLVSDALESVNKTIRFFNIPTWQVV